MKRREEQEERIKNWRFLRFLGVLNYSKLQFIFHSMFFLMLCSKHLEYIFRNTKATNLDARGSEEMNIAAKFSVPMKHRRYTSENICSLNKCQAFKEQPICVLFKTR